MMSGLGKGRVWVVTVLVSAKNKNALWDCDPFEIVETICKLIREQVNDKVVVLFPAGWLTSRGRVSQRFIEEVGEKLSPCLPTGVVVCFGLDGDTKGRLTKDQMAMSVSSRGIEAVGRKFYPTNDREYNHARLAEDHLAREHGHSRVLSVAGHVFYLAICYDVFGLQYSKIANVGIDAVLSLVHGFNPSGQGGSGTGYFARYGFAGAAQEWGVPVFGAAVFYGRDIPQRWPSGVIWNQGDIEKKHWTYAHNPLRPIRVFRKSLGELDVEVRVFRLGKESKN